MDIKEGLDIGIGKIKSKINSVSNEKKIEAATREILFETHQAEYEAFDERDIELVAGRINLNRKELLYYPNVKKYVEMQDALFRQLLPIEFKKTLKSFDSADKRWPHAMRLAKQLQDRFGFGSPQQGGIVDCRAKSLFSIWMKMGEYKLESDEIYDRFGIRITVRNTESARKVSQHLLDENVLMMPHKFAHGNGKIHQPLSDTLDTPNIRGFASIRMDFVDPEIGIYEIQIHTMENYLISRKHEKSVFASLAASPKYGLVMDLE
jgi:hypothetical protein